MQAVVEGGGGVQGGFVRRVGGEGRGVHQRRGNLMMGLLVRLMLRVQKGLVALR